MFFTVPVVSGYLVWSWAWFTVCESPILVLWFPLTSQKHISRELSKINWPYCECAFAWCPAMNWHHLMRILASGSLFLGQTPGLKEQTKGVECCKELCFQECIKIGRWYVFTWLEKKSPRHGDEQINGFTYLHLFTKPTHSLRCMWTQMRLNSISVLRADSCTTARWPPNDQKLEKSS